MFLPRLPVLKLWTLETVQTPMITSSCVTTHWRSSTGHKNIDKCEDCCDDGDHRCTMKNGVQCCDGGEA